MAADGSVRQKLTALLLGLMCFYMSTNTILLHIRNLSRPSPGFVDPLQFGFKLPPDSWVIPSVLFVIDTTEKNYNTRVKDIRNTYMKRVSEKSTLDLIFVGSIETDGSDNIIASSCPMGYWEDSCKRADMITAAYDRLTSGGANSSDWIFFADDDAYLLPDNIQRMIMSLGPDAVNREAVWGIPACVKDGCNGLCGGGGYFTNRATLAKIQLGGDKAKYPSIRNETNKFDEECGRCGDLTIARVIRDHRHIPLVMYPKGSYTWHFEDHKNGDAGLIQSLNTTDPIPWLYHYPAKNRFHHLHMLAVEMGSNKKLPDDSS